MKICVKSLTPLLFLALLTYTGCAKQELVRKDDSIASTPSSAKQLDSTSAAAKSAAPTAQTTEKNLNRKKSSSRSAKTLNSLGSQC